MLVLVLPHEQEIIFPTIDKHNVADMKLINCLSDTTKFNEYNKQLKNTNVRTWVFFWFVMATAGAAKDG